MSSTIDQLIAKARAELATPETVKVGIAIAGEVVEFEFERMSGRDWVDQRATHPPRPGSVIDSNLGYDAHALAEDVAPLCGYQLVDGEHVHLTAEAWGQLFGYRLDKDERKERIPSVFSGADIELIATVLWGVNVFDPKKRADAAKKASQAKPRRKRS